MASWNVDRDGHRLIIETVGDGQVSLDIVPTGVPFTADVATAQDIRIKIGAAISVAYGDGAS